jgi:mono/diheme cytochrome c family protein
MTKVAGRSDVQTSRRSDVQTLRRSVVSMCLLGSALNVLTSDRLSAQDVRGRAVYDKWCAGCHGEDGRGEGESAGYMLPRPRDFTRALYQIRSTASGELPTDADLRRVIDEGMPGTAMPGWRSKLTNDERADVIAYIKSFSRFFDGASPEPMEFGRNPGGGVDAVAAGEEVYRQLECFRCHGERGRGEGTSAPTLEDDWDYAVRAADLTAPWLFNGGGRVEDIYRRLRTGLDGTPMPSFGDVIEAGLITDEQLWQLAYYVRSLGPDRSPPRVRDVIRAVRVETTVPSEPGDTAWATVERFYVPLVGQIIEAPRRFAPRVDGVWVQAVHDGQTLAMRVSWSDPSRSPDPSWQEWLERLGRTLTPPDDPLPATQGPDRLHVQFPLRLTEGMERPYFLGGDTRSPVYLWRWTSQPDRLEEGTATGLGTFTSSQGAGATHTARFDAGRWQLVVTRPLVVSGEAAAPAFVQGRAIPVAFYAADGSEGEGEVRGAVSSWFQIYLDVPTPTTAYVAPVVAMLLTAGLGVMIVFRAQRRGR